MSAAGQDRVIGVLKYLALAIAILIAIYCLFLWNNARRHHAKENPSLNISDVMTPLVGGGRLVGVYDVDIKQANVDLSDGLSDEEDVRLKNAFVKLRIININKDDQPTHYTLWVYRRNAVADPINVLFEVNQRRKAFDEKDKYLMFNEVLRPIKVIGQAEVVNLLAGNIENHLQAPFDFPNGCVLLAYDESLGGAYGAGYKAAKACGDTDSRASIVGRLNVRGAALCTNIVIRIEGRAEKITRKPQDMNCFRKLDLRHNKRQ